jgi:hypothetical protein
MTTSNQKFGVDAAVKICVWNIHQTMGNIQHYCVLNIDILKCAGISLILVIVTMKPNQISRVVEVTSHMYKKNK